MRHLYFFILFAASSACAPLLAQHRLESEIKTVADQLVAQLNRHPEISSVGLADLSRTDYSPSALGEFLTQELYTTLIMHPDRKFNIINRGQLQALIAEANLDADGLLAPANVPRLGNLTAIDLIVGGTLSANANQTRLNLIGIELENQNAIVAARGNVTLSTSMQRMDPVLSGLAAEPETADPADPQPAAGGIGRTITHEQLTFVAQGCQNNGPLTTCTYEVTSRGTDANLSLYTSRSKTKSPSGADIQIVQAQLGEARGRSSVTSVLYADEPQLLSLSLRGSVPANGLVLEIPCLSNLSGVFSLPLPCP